MHPGVREKRTEKRLRGSKREKAVHQSAQQPGEENHHQGRQEGGKIREGLLQRPGAKTNKSASEKMEAHDDLKTNPSKALTHG